jgi:hypothetical protein
MKIKDLFEKLKNVNPEAEIQIMFWANADNAVECRCEEVVVGIKAVPMESGGIRHYPIITLHTDDGSRRRG